MILKKVLRLQKKSICDIDFNFKIIEWIDRNESVKNSLLDVSSIESTIIDCKNLLVNKSKLNYFQIEQFRKCIVLLNEDTSIDLSYSNIKIAHEIINSLEEPNKFYLRSELTSYQFKKKNQFK